MKLKKAIGYTLLGITLIFSLASTLYQYGFLMGFAYIAASFIFILLIVYLIKNDEPNERSTNLKNKIKENKYEAKNEE